MSLNLVFMVLCLPPAKIIKIAGERNSECDNSCRDLFSMPPGQKNGRFYGREAVSSAAVQENDRFYGRAVRMSELRLE